MNLGGWLLQTKNGDIPDPAPPPAARSRPRSLRRLLARARGEPGPRGLRIHATQKEDHLVVRNKVIAEMRAHDSLRAA